MPTASRTCSTSRRRSGWSPTSTRCVARYRTGEPLAYVLGRWSFRHLDLAVDSRVLIPRPETEVVAGVAIELARADAAPGHRRRPRHRLGCDRAGARRRAAGRRRDGVADRRVAGRPRRRPGQPRRDRPPWRQRPHRRGLVVRRPAATASCSTSPSPTRPTSPTGRPTSTDPSGDWEPHEALFAGPDGLDDIRVLVVAAPGRVRPGGWLVLEIGADQGRPVERRCSTDAGFGDVAIRPDLPAATGSPSAACADRAASFARSGQHISRSGRRSRRAGCPPPG